MPRYRGSPDRKIDYIFTEGAVKANTCRIVPGVLSDHLPLEAVMEIWPLNFPT